MLSMGETIRFEDEHSRWTIETSDEPGIPRLQMLRVGHGTENMDREFDRVYWQRLGGTAISRAACELADLTS